MNITNTTLLFIIVLSVFNIAYAQNAGIDSVVGKKYMIDSEALKEKREIQIFLPDSYEKSDKRYPVLYILDGQRLYLYGVSLLKSFTHFKQTPEFIVVGITNKYPQRFGHFSDGAAKFLDFIEKDVIAFTDKTFRTSRERLLFGWEYGGGFVIQTMTDKPQLFDAYLAASPYPLSDPQVSTSKTRKESVERFFSKKPEFDKFLYFTVSVKEGVVEEGTDYLNSVLKKKAPKTMTWTYRKLDGEEHRSTPYATIYHGVKNYYHFYPELQFITLDEFTKAGGLANVYKHYKERARLFGFSPEVASWTKFTIIRGAIRAKNFDQFDAFVTKFKSNDFIGKLRGGRPYSIAEFYEEHKAYEKAIDIYRILATEHPDSARPFNALGNTYKLLGKYQKAKENYEKAVELAGKSSDARLKEYEKNLAELKKP
jgi:enterochelin esterase-like enzyme